MPRDYSYGIAGERHRNRDGSSRQQEIARCRPGEPIHLIGEPDNAHDPNAVAVFSGRGVQVGYLKSQHAARICGEIEDGEINAIVERVEGGGQQPLQLVIRLNFDGKMPRLPAAPPRPQNGQQLPAWALAALVFVVIITVALTL